MSKAEGCCWTSISETQAVEFQVEKHLYWLVKGTRDTEICHANCRDFPLGEGL